MDISQLVVAALHGMGHCKTQNTDEKCGKEGERLQL
jgi:hypothetical protein